MSKRLKLTSENVVETVEKALLLAGGVVALKLGVISLDQLSEFAAPLKAMVDDNPTASTLLSGTVAVLVREFLRADK